ncbi:DUF6869 domain-containing protein [Pontivivens ytuae]|uniref:DUF6869 domain-containing protein n=1 Tax=Pontivivens ytuae TaxID=2789856 RepID=A0A7S9LSX0_9RHOB|nr:hypothetical protein [Pontivivens ytuae]QPH54699.1 hypothetical protein I0K15_02655 [Pontivivens ytuae]
MPDGWVCLGCKYGEGKPPCRTSDGAFRPDHVADAYLEYCGDRGSDADRDAFFWAWNCLNDRITEAGDLRDIFATLDALLSKITSVEGAADVAAGPLENLVAYRGSEAIDWIENRAASSERFRYLLTGVWSQGERCGADIWARVEAARAGGSHMDLDGLPPLS